MAACRITVKIETPATVKFQDGDARGKTETWPETQVSHIASGTVLTGNGTHLNPGIHTYLDLSTAHYCYNLRLYTAT